MKRAKQRKREFSWFREVERDLWREMTKPVEVPPRGRMFNGEIGKLDCGITIVDGEGKKWKV